VQLSDAEASGRFRSLCSELRRLKRNNPFHAAGTSRQKRKREAVEKQKGNATFLASLEQLNRFCKKKALETGQIIRRSMAN